jgi:hypothetical protein
VNCDQVLDCRQKNWISPDAGWVGTGAAVAVGQVVTKREHLPARRLRGAWVGGPTWLSYVVVGLAGLVVYIDFEFDLCGASHAPRVQFALAVTPLGDDLPAVLPAVQLVPGGLRIGLVAVTAGDMSFSICIGKCRWQSCRKDLVLVAMSPTLPSLVTKRAAI